MLALGQMIDQAYMGHLDLPTVASLFDVRCAREHAGSKHDLV